MLYGYHDLRDRATDSIFLAALEAYKYSKSFTGNTRSAGQNLVIISGLQGGDKYEVEECT